MFLVSRFFQYLQEWSVHKLPQAHVVWSKSMDHLKIRRREIVKIWDKQTNTKVKLTQLLSLILNSNATVNERGQCQTFVTVNSAIYCWKPDIIMQWRLSNADVLGYTLPTLLAKPVLLLQNNSFWKKKVKMCIKTGISVLKNVIIC